MNAYGRLGRANNDLHVPGCYITPPPPPAPQKCEDSRLKSVRCSNLTIVAYAADVCSRRSRYSISIGVSMSRHRCRRVAGRGVGRECRWRCADHCVVRNIWLHFVACYISGCNTVRRRHNYSKPPNQKQVRQLS